MIGIKKGIQKAAPSAASAVNGFGLVFKLLQNIPQLENPSNSHTYLIIADSLSYLRALSNCYSTDTLIQCTYTYNTVPTIRDTNKNSVHLDS